jgi:hypothetical protein
MFSTIENASAVGEAVVGSVDDDSAMIELESETDGTGGGRPFDARLWPHAMATRIDGLSCIHSSSNQLHMSLSKSYH